MSIIVWLMFNWITGTINAGYNPVAVTWNKPAAVVQRAAGSSLRK